MKHANLGDNLSCPLVPPEGLHFGIGQIRITSLNSSSSTTMRLTFVFFIKMSQKPMAGLPRHLDIHISLG